MTRLKTPIFIVQRRNLGRLLAAVVFAALTALAFACSDSPSSTSTASVQTPPPSAATPAPSPASTPSPTATATPSPTATATPSPTATATASPTATATASPTATARPVATPAPGVPSVISHSAAISDANPLIAFVSVSLSSPARVAVEYENEYAGKFRTALSERAVEHVVPVARLRADTAYEYAVGVETPGGALAYGARGEFATGELALFATARSAASGRSTQSLMLTDYYAQFSDNLSFKYLLMRDELGEVVWIHVDSRRGDPERRPGALVVHTLPNGNLLYVHGAWRRELGFYEITPLGEPLNKITLGDKGDLIHHDFVPLDDGRIVYISRYNFTFDDSANGGREETTARIGTLSVYDPSTGTFERVWDSMKFWDITDPAQRVEWPEGASVVSMTHLNSLSQSPDGGWIISSRNRHQVISISPDFQTIRWQLGGPDSDFDFPDPTDMFHAQHTATQLPNGNVLVFDNRADMPDGDGYYSRALELRLDFDAMTAVKAWEFSPDPPIYSSHVSSAYRLDNGNTLINFGLSADPATIPIAIIEADAEGREVFRLETIDPPVAEEADLGPRRYRALPGRESVIGETMLRAPKPKP